VAPSTEIEVDYAEGENTDVRLHDGSKIRLKKIDPDYDPSNRARALDFMEAHRARAEVVTGLLYIDEELPTFHDIAGTASQPLTSFDCRELSPGAEALAEFQKGLR